MTRPRPAALRAAVLVALAGAALQVPVRADDAGLLDFAVANAPGAAEAGADGAPGGATTSRAATAGAVASLVPLPPRRPDAAAAEAAEEAPARRGRRGARVVTAALGAGEEATAPAPSPAVASLLPLAPQAAEAPAAAPSEQGLRALIAQHAAANRVPVALANAVIRVESRHNPRARNGPYHGLTQLSLRTAQGMGYRGTSAGLMDPATNLAWGLKYLGQAHALAGGDTCRTVMKYQGGHRSTTMTGANRAYCAKVRAHGA